MSEFVKEDWKLKAHAEVKLRRENTNMLVSLSYVQLRRLASALIHVYSTFRSSAVIGLLRPHPRPRELTYIYNTILNFILVSFCSAYIIVAFRVRIRVRV